MRVGNLGKAIVLNICDKERSDLVDGDVLELIFFLTVVVERTETNRPEADLDPRSQENRLRQGHCRNTYLQCRGLRSAVGQLCP
jgi:hypothetical protein